MVKKIISALLITLMGVSMAAPLYSFENCAMPCCVKIENSCCDSQIKTDCPMEMKQCDQSLVILIVSGPKAQIEQYNSLPAANYSDAAFILPTSQTFELLNNRQIYKLPPVSFLPPLRV